MVALATSDGHTWLRHDQIYLVEPTTDGRAVVILSNGLTRYIEMTTYEVIDAMDEAVYPHGSDQRLESDESGAGGP